MLTLHDKNGLITWDEGQIRKREYLIDYFSTALRIELVKINRAIQFHRCESPILTPDIMVSNEYTLDDVYKAQDELTLRPETTKGSYLYAQKLIDEGATPPIVVWQVGKSFRREQDAPTSRMKLKEFYQIEFQFVYSTGSKCDYYQAVLMIMHDIFHDLNNNTRLEPSDRLPSYSIATNDINFLAPSTETGFFRILELCSISHRTDFPCKDGKYRVVEVAIGLDRCVVSL